MERPPEIQSELQKAHQARERGNEGQARVCARRAAGLAAHYYLTARGAPPPTSSALDLLSLIADDALLPPRVKAYAAHLILRVDEEFRLPPGIDLVAEAGQLCDELLDESPPAVG